MDLLLSPRYGHVILVGGFPVLSAVNWPLDEQYYFEGFPLVRIDLNDWRARREGGRGGLAFFTIPTCFLLLMIPLETLNEHAIQSIKFFPYILKTIICIVFIYNCHQLPTTWDSLRKPFSFLILTILINCVMMHRAGPGHEFSQKCPFF